MTGHDRPFSADEYQRRIAKTRARMASAGLDFLFVQDPSNMAWLTGYDGWSFYVHQGVLLGLEGDPVWWGRMQDVNGALRTVWMPDDRVIGYAEHYVQTPERHPMQDLATRIVDLGFTTSRIGVELDNYYYSAKAHLTLVEALPEAAFLDATGLVNWCRTVKSDEEIAFLRKAARISEKMIDGILERTEPGIRKNELVASIYHDALTGVGDDWGDYPAIVPLLATGADGAAPHLTWTGDDLVSGEATFFEIAGCYRRYHAPLCRTVFLGKPPQDMLDAEQALIEGLGAALDAARAGNRACDVAAGLNGALHKAGIERSARCGYPIGLSYPPDWGERTISFRPEDETVLEPGMTFHLMPGLWMENWGIAITESILIRDHGPAETFCDRPRKMFVKD
ncbi:MAG: M24 family metallopeptidase [Pseudomonadota bacterium]